MHEPESRADLSFASPRERLDYRRVARALAFIDDRAPRAPALAEVARHVGLSEGHLQRTFTALVGVSPKRYVQAQLSVRARRLLEADHSVLTTAAALGLSGTGRLHDLMIATERLTPGQVRRAQDLALRYGLVATPLGDLCAVRSERGVCAAHFVDDEPAMSAWLRARYPGAQLVREDAVAGELASRIFPGGTPAPKPMALLLRGTTFQLQVWAALLAIPTGTTTSYSELACALGKPKGARAVAGAVAHNPLAILIPCHRVLRREGSLGGYRWGLERKRLLLAREQVQFFTPEDTAVASPL